MKYIVTVNGKDFEVDVAVANGEVSVASVAQAPKAVPAPVAPVAPVAPAAPVAASAASTKVEAPMPGNIWKVLKQVGETVKEGEAIIILEAMKMENEILAPCDGTIATIVAAGGTVNSGEVLATIA